MVFIIMVYHMYQINYHDDIFIIMVYHHVLSCIDAELLGTSPELSLLCRNPLFLNDVAVAASSGPGTQVEPGDAKRGNDRREHQTSLQWVDD